MMEKRIPVWLDVDTGIDDAQAILAVSRLPLDIRGISAVNGNVSLEHTLLNTRRVCALAGLNVPVYPGADRPLFRDPCPATHVHGADGLCGAELPEPRGEALTTPAWDALWQEARRRPGELQVVATGPLTNLAIAFAKYPQLPSLLKRILLMGGGAEGGGIRGGNSTPAAEFNFFADPHAAQAVCKCGAPLVICGLDVTMRAYLTPDEKAVITNCGSAAGRFFGQATARNLQFHLEKGVPGLCLHDMCPLLYLTHPQLFSGQEAGVYVETRGTYTFGQMVTDLWSDFQFPKKNAFVVLDVDRPAFVQLVQSLLTAV